MSIVIVPLAEIAALALGCLLLGVLIGRAMVRRRYTGEVDVLHEALKRKGRQLRDLQWDAVREGPGRQTSRRA